MVLMLAVVACDTFVTFQRLGVSPGEDSSIRIHYLTCEPERLTAVRLVDGKDPAVQDDNEVLWEIRSDDGAEGGAFTVGSQPDGFVETVAFSGLASTDNLVAAVEIQGSGGAAITFSVADLENDKVWAPGDPDSNIDPETFEQQARDSCA